MKTSIGAVLDGDFDPRGLRLKLNSNIAVKDT